MQTAFVVLEHRGLDFHMFLKYEVPGVLLGLGVLPKMMPLRSIQLVAFIYGLSCFTAE